MSKGRYLKCTIHRCDVSGWFCICCRPGKRYERKVFRALKRSERQRWIKEVLLDL